MTFTDGELTTIIKALDASGEVFTKSIKNKIEWVRRHSVFKRYSLHDVDWLIVNGRRKRVSAKPSGRLLEGWE